MTINQLKKILPSALKNKRNILLKSAPGIGKTECVEAIVKEIGYDLMICHPVIEDPTDAKGLPATFNNDGETTAEFIPYGNLRRMMNATKPLVVFIDDLGQSVVTVQAAYMQIIQQREINGKKISDYVRFIAATNSRKDNAGVAGLITPLLSRFAGIFEIVVDADSWINWAVSHDMPAELVAYIKAKPAMLSTFQASKEIENFACPRTISNLGHWINDGIDELEVWEGAVGKPFAIEFFAFYKMFKAIGNLPDQILIDPIKTSINHKPDILYFIMIALSNRSKDAKKFEVVMQYIERLEVEYQAFFMQMVTTKLPRLRETETYNVWAVKNQSFIQ